MRPRYKNHNKKEGLYMKQRFRSWSGFSLIAPLLFAIPTAFANDNFVNRISVFGDSLADSGYYSSLSPSVPPGLAFTTRPDPVAPEVFASELGLELRSAYGVGGTNYATGAARVSLPGGLSIPITTQIDRVLAGGE